MIILSIICIVIFNEITVVDGDMNSVKIFLIVLSLILIDYSCADDVSILNVLTDDQISSLRTAKQSDYSIRILSGEMGALSE